MGTWTFFFGTYNHSDENVENVMGMKNRFVAVTSIIMIIMPGGLYWL